MSKRKIDVGVQDFSRQQCTALEKILEWRRTQSSLLYRSFGFAGTGKTTMIKHLAASASMLTDTNELGREVSCWDIPVVAFTGKAAQVLRGKGVAHAQTLHSLIYVSQVQSEAELDELKDKLKQAGLSEAQKNKIQRRIYELIEILNSPQFVLDREKFKVVRPEMIIIDECSMLDDEMGRDLLSLGIPILMFGDPMQLGPVGQRIGYFMTSDPDSMLTEIHRQAEDNFIIKVATAVRSGEALKSMKIFCDDVKIVPEIPFKEEWSQYNQIIVGTNYTRMFVNSRMRRMLGFKSAYPEVGEKLICLKNNNKRNLFNGSIWEVTGMPPDDVLHGLKSEIIHIKMRSPVDGTESEFPVWRDRFTMDDQAFKRKRESWQKRKPAEEFDYGYAITVHKAQGSEWDNVLLIDESHCWSRDGTAKNHLYTGITRAANQLTVVRDYRKRG